MKFSPGKSPGVYTIIGQFEQLAGGELEIELAGAVAGTQYDQLFVNGTAVLNGSVVVKHLDGFAATVGTEFDIVAATTLVDNGFSLAMLNGGLVEPTLTDLEAGTTLLRLTSIAGKRHAPISGAWGTATNWTDGTLPGASDTAFLPGDTASNTTVNGPDVDTTVLSLVVGIGNEERTSTTTLDLSSGMVSTTRGTTLRRDGRLAGEGTLGGDLYNAGGVAPGDSTGTIQVTGNYHQNETGTLAIELGGTTPGAKFDQLIITGAAALDGVLNVHLIDLGNGVFEPQGGDSFRILTAKGEVGGAFGSVNLPSLAGPLTWQLDYEPNSVELRTALVGDYDNSGAVEQADLDLVLLNWGADVTLFPLPPEWLNQRPIEGLIDQADLDAVLLSWGNSIALLTAASGEAVPEPSSAFLLLSAATGATGVLLRLFSKS